IVRDSARGKTFGARVRPWLRFRPRDLKPVAPRVGEPRTGLSMGEHCELMAKEWKIGRAEQDELAFQSHVKAARAWREGFYAGLVGPREGLLMAPTYAVPAMLDRAGITLQDFDIYEIHEAFAAQVLCTLKAWESAEYCRTKLQRSAPLGSIDRAKLNPKGGSV